jgi:xanthine dehydrogenase accessory factor
MDILQEILTALQTEDRVLLATIITTSGSTPAAAFSKMLIRQEGKLSVGTVGGGCMEGDVLAAAKDLYGQNRARILTFHLNEDDMVQGLICGGSLDVLIEPVTRQSIPLFEELRSLRDEGEDCIVATGLDAHGKIELKQIVKTTDKSWSIGVLEKWRKQSSITPRLTLPAGRHGAGQASLPTRTSELSEALRKAHDRNETRCIKTEHGELILEPVLGHPHLIIFGGGHVSKYISSAASMSGFRVTVIDDREQYANPKRFPEADETLAVEYYEAFNRITIKPSTYIVIVTRGHRSDEDILEQAIKTPARYIGMIGSARKVLATYEHLVQRGVSVNALKRVRAPIGIEIGAVTAEEIGVSVVAELIATRRGEEGKLLHKSQAMKDLFARLVKKTL